MNDRIYALIGKYALLISLFYMLSYAFKLTVNTFEFGSELRDLAYIRGIGPITLDLLLNIIAAFLVQRDVNRYKIKNSYVVLATVLYRPLGIFAFLLFLILQETHVKQQTNE